MKGDSQRHSCELFKEGMKAPEIAAIRKLNVGTIESHFAWGIKAEILKVEELLEASRIKTIQNCIAELNSDSLSRIKEKLGEDFSFSEIRYVLASIDRLNPSSPKQNKKSRP